MLSQSPGLWRECAQWLIRCGILDENHRVTWPNADILDFAQILRDGVILCQLANRLVRGCLDLREVNLRPQLSQFLCLKNICVFLRSCQTTFEMAPTDLFEAWQLYKVADFARVLHTLSVLSNSPVALRVGIPGFPEDLESPTSSGHEYYNDEIYRNLAEKAETRELEEEVYNQLSDEEQYGKIYDVIITRPASGKSAILRKTSKPVQEEEFVPRDKREHCVKELLDTERNYVDALNMMLTKFYTPLREVLTPDDHKIIFMNLQELAQIHTAFQSELGKAARASVAGTGGGRLGEVFVRWKPKFVAYSEYCSNMSDAQLRIEQLCADNPSVKQKIVECQSDANENRFRLQDLLSVPMQRVLKYHLILKELVKNTDAKHEDRTSLELGLDAMLDLSLYINEVKRDCEILQLVRDVQSSIVDLSMPENTDLKDYGRLLKDGELKLCSHEDRKIKHRYVFIFDKVLMICKNIKGNQYTYKSAMILDEYRMEDLETDNNNRTLPLMKGPPKWAHSWTLVHKLGHNVYQLYCKSRESKDGWMNAIKAAHDNIFPSSAQESDHRFQYFSFSDTTTCSICQKLLRGLFYQGYKCQQCNMAVHRDCMMGSYGCGRLRRPMSFSHGELGSSVAVVGQKLRAVKNFNGNNGGPEFLNFLEDDIIEILSVDTGHADWWKGRVVDGVNVNRIGLFPSSHVRRQKNPSRTETWHGETGGKRSSPPTPRTAAPPLVTPPPPLSSYVNLVDDPSAYHWYCGTLDRESAEAQLHGMGDGAFLVRFSEKQSRYAISISYNGEVKHVKVEQGPEGFWLDEGPPPFSSIAELVQYYEKHNMQESFQALNTTLKIPLKAAVVGYAVALHNFEATAANMISLGKGQQVMILSKNGNERGWWRGKVGDKMGYFPLAYVCELGVGQTPPRPPSLPQRVSSSSSGDFSPR